MNNIRLVKIKRYFLAACLLLSALYGTYAHEQSQDDSTYHIIQPPSYSKIKTKMKDENSTIIPFSSSISRKNPFFQYSSYKRKNNVFLTTYDLCRNMDDRIEDITGNNGIASYRYMAAMAGIKLALDPRRYKGHIALEKYYDLLERNPDLYHRSAPYSVSLLTEPFFQNSRQQQHAANIPPNPAQIHFQPLVSVTDPFQTTKEINSDEQMLPKVPDYPEHPSIPFFIPQARDVNQNQKPIHDSTQNQPKRAIEPTAQTKQPDTPKPVLRSPTQILYDEAIGAFEKRNYPKARILFQQMLERNPESAQTLFAQGITSLYSGDYKSSLAQIEKSLEIAKRNNSSTDTLWQIPIHKSDYDFHYKKLTRRAKQNPNARETNDLLLLLANMGESK